MYSLVCNNPALRQAVPRLARAAASRSYSGSHLSNNFFYLFGCQYSLHPSPNRHCDVQDLQVEWRRRFSKALLAGLMTVFKKRVEYAIKFEAIGIEPEEYCIEHIENHSIGWL
tara:strand:+ start:1285 stop:1623 length:339 start_codon:yes stop_codon:yes gene_type:complete